MLRRVMIAAALVMGSVGAAAAQVPPPAARPTIASLVAAIDVDPDMLHNDFTPAVWGLCGYGLDGARAVLPLLDAASEMTRMHASRALECAVATWFGWQPGRIEDPRSGARRRYEAAWRANGGYDWNAAPAARRAMRDQWAAWLAARVNAAPPPPDEPSTDAIRAALALAMPAAQACGASGRAFATITFASRGDVQRVRVHGARGRVARCIERALGGARVPPFGKRTSTLSISVAR
jgi:hypothetical protein